MTSSKEKFARERLQWVERCRQGILSAIGDDVVSPQFKVFPTVDPLRFILKISLRIPLGKDTRAPLRTYIRCCADELDCEVPIINIQERWVQAEVLTKQRVWSRDAKGRFKGGQRFKGRAR